jgi:hypothetical protein
MGWKEIDAFHWQLYKRILGISRFAANGVAKLEF